MFDLAWKHAGPVVEDAKKQAKPILGKEDLISIDKKKLREPKTQVDTKNVRKCPLNSLRLLVTFCYINRKVSAAAMKSK